MKFWINQWQCWLISSCSTPLPSPSKKRTREGEPCFACISCKRPPLFRPRAWPPSIESRESKSRSCWVGCFATFYPVSCMWSRNGQSPIKTNFWLMVDSFALGAILIAGKRHMIKLSIQSPLSTHQYGTWMLYIPGPSIWDFKWMAIFGCIFTTVPTWLNLRPSSNRYVQTPTHQTKRWHEFICTPAVVKQDQFILKLGPISNLYNMIPKGPFRCLGGDKMMNLVIHIIAGNLRSIAQKRGVAANHKGTNLRKGLVPTDLERNHLQANSSSYDEFKTKVWWNHLWSPPKTWVYPTVIAKSIYKPSFFTRTKANDSHDDRLLWRVGSFCSPQFLPTLPLRYILKGRLFFERNGENWRICIDLNGFAGFKLWYFEISL